MYFFKFEAQPFPLKLNNRFRNPLAILQELIYKKRNFLIDFDEK